MAALRTAMHTHWEERGKTLNQQGTGHTNARSKNTKRYTRSKVNKGKDTKVTDLLREEVLNPRGDLPVRDLQSKVDRLRRGAAVSLVE